MPFCFLFLVKGGIKTSGFKCLSMAKISKYREYGLVDFLKDESFVRWVREPDEDTPFPNALIEKYPEKRGDILLARELILSLGDTNHQPLTGDESTFILNDLLEENKKQELKVIPFWKKAKYLKVAASLLLMGVLTFLLSDNWLTQKQIPVEANNREVVKSNPYGQKSTIFLGDGSKVILNHGSTIRYNQPFEKESRLIELEGEAFFEVAKDPRKPFRVLSGNLTTEALGTSFNIRARPEDSDIRISLRSGKVKITSREEKSSPGEKDYVISTGQELSFNKDSGSYDISEFDPDTRLAWRSGVIVFNKAERPEILSRLERWYGVTIKESNEPVTEWGLTVKYDNQSLEKILLSLSYVMNFEYEINEKLIIIHHQN